MSKPLLPPALTLLFVALVGVDAATSAIVVVPEPLGWLGLPLIAAGLALAVAARRQFARARTEIHTFGQPTTLVTTGVFRYGRNPMYLGLVAVVAGSAVLAGTVTAALLAGLFVLLVDRWYITTEEGTMRGTFGEAYDAYVRRTRRWF